MVDFVEYVISELQSKRLAKVEALDLIGQFFARPTDNPRLHPLVERNVSTLTRQRYRTRLTGEEFFLRDHQIRMPGGNVARVLPGVAYLEMARAAVADAVPNLVEASLVAFEDVLWLSPLVVDSERDVYIDIDAGEDFLEFRIFSQDAGNEDTDHASGRVRLYDTVEAAPLNIASIREQMAREHWDCASVYQQYSRVGIEYGPAHRGIVQLHSGQEQVLAELALPQALAGEDNSAYLLHPALLDSALQAAIGLGRRDVVPSESLLPFALDSLCILGPCGDALYAFVRRIQPAVEGGSPLVLDLDLCDRDGNICVQMRGFRARRLDAAAVEILVAVPEWGAYRRVENSGPAALDFAHRRALLCDFPAIDISAPTRTLGEVATILCAGQEHPAASYESAALQVFAHLQAVLKQHAGSKALVQCVIPDTAEGLLLAGLSSMLKTATLENPALTTQMIITNAQASWEQVQGYLSHASTQAGITSIQYSADQWRSLDWKVQSPPVVEPADPLYKEEGVYVITGGLGGLGRLLAREILRQTQRSQVVLTGRAPLDAKIQQQMMAVGFETRVHYRRLDLNDLAHCTATIEDVLRNVGRIQGVFHCAGARSDNVIIKKTAEEVAQVLQPKVRGTWHLDAATQHLDLDFFALFSSGVSVFGNVGQADYAAANGFMDAFARRREQLRAQQLRRGRTVAINWPLWQEGGMRPAEDSVQWLQAQTGMAPMQTASAMAVLHRALAGEDAQIVALEGDGAKLRRLFDAPAASRTVEHTPPALPNPERLETSADLLARTQAFLRKEFAPILKIAAAQIDVHEPLENYGINSILAMNLTRQLEQQLGPLQKTLFFEYQTLAELSAHLAHAHEPALQRLLAPAKIATTEPVRAVEKQTPRATQKLAMRGKAASLPAITRAQPSRLTASEPIAVIGLSGRYPEAETVQDYWRNLLDGKDCVIEIPRERWRWEDFYTSDRDQRGHYSKWGGFISGADEFDPQFFNISPREAPYIDPQERLFLQHAWMAMEDAGYTRKSLQVPRANGLAGQVGVYVGVMYGEYNRSGSLASIANRVSYVLNLHGPSMTLDTMCSSSLTAIHLACQDLRTGGTDLAIAGGVNLSIHPGKYSMLSAGQFISSAGHCQSFGEGGDGYIPGEGVGAVILKRLSDAERDGDAIYAIIRGSALNHGGKTNGYTVPNPQAQAAVIGQALRDAGISARQVSYIEAHGTGTKLGDPIEIAALSKAFQQYTGDTQFCLLGSAKSNIGHCESAAGIAGLTKVVLQLRHRQIVPSLHSQRLNPNIDFECSPFIVNQQLRDWEAPVVDGKPVARIAGLSSFGAGGANAHFVIEEYNAAESIVNEAMAAPVIVPLSARTAEQLTQKMRDLLDFVRTEGGRRIDLTSLAYTLQVGREAMDERLCFVVESVPELERVLRACLDGDTGEVFRGHVKAHKETLALFAADAAFEQALDQWIEQRSLAKLAELWVRGLDLDWQKFYGQQRPRRAHLPSYPFAKDKYWIDPNKGLFPVDVPSQSQTPTVIHPLLHANTSDLEQLRFSSVFHANELTPSAMQCSMLLEMACAALNRARRAPQAGALELRSLRFGESFVADGERALHIALYPSADDVIDFDIYSNDAGERVHSQGSGVFTTSVRSERIDIDAIKRRLHEVPLSSNPSPSARRAWLGAQEMLIGIDSGDVGKSDPDECSLPPALVQSVLDTAATALHIGDATPEMIESLCVMFACTPSMRVWVRWRDGATNVWDMDWCDASGTVCLRWRGLSLAVSAHREDDAPAVTVQVVPAAVGNGLTKPSAVALAELSAMPAIAQTALTKPDISQLIALEDAPATIARVDSVSAPVVAAAVVTQMPVEQVSARTAGVDVKTLLKRTLAQALYLDEASIDDDRSFVDLGLDSIVGVEWVKRINKELGLSIAATRVYDHASVAALSTYIQSQLPTNEPAVVVKALDSAPLGVERLQQELQLSLARALYLDVDAIDSDRSFVDLGLDSIVGVEWVKAINKTYGLQIPATRVYDYANIRALAGLVHAELARLPIEVPAPKVEISPPARVATVKLPALKRRSRTLATLASAQRDEEPNRHQEKIAIVGMAGRYPGAENLAQFWSNLVAGRNSIQQIPADRWDVDAYYDPEPGKLGKVYCKWLGVLEGAEHFDPLFFQISPSEAEIMDPQHRLFMQESYRAFEDAGYSSTKLSNTKCGVYLGIMSNEYAFLLAKGNPQNVETTGNSFAIGAARIAYHLNLKGPAIPIDTACSSSLVAVHLACQALLNREIDMGLAGGVSLYLVPDSYVGMCRAGMLSREGQCKTFDNGADGFVPGEGVGTVVLKRLSDAERDGDSIYGVIIGSGINQDGKTNGITAPSVNSQIELEREIYRKHQIDAASISYVETHGTGTKLGDPIELEALATVFKEHTSQQRFCALGAVKTNIGHTSGAAGVAGLHKALLCLQNRKLVPSLNMTQENALFDFANSPFYVNQTVRDWTAAPGVKRRAAISAFGFSGTNAHVVIEEYTAAPREEAVPPQTYIVPLSARSAEQLRTRAQDILVFLERANCNVSLRDFAYTLQVGRDAMRERCAWVVDSIEELQAQLRAFLASDANVSGYRGAVARTQDSAGLAEQLASLRRGGGLQQSASIAKLWTEGADVDWSSLYAGTLPQRLHLPGYPFAKERYWVQPTQSSSEAAPLAEPKEGKQKTYYAAKWRASSLPPRNAPFGHEDTLLILDADDRLFEQVQARLLTATPLQAIVLVQLAGTYQQHSADRFSVDAGRPEHFDKLIETLRAQGKHPTRVIHNLNGARLLSNDGQVDGDDQTLERALQVGVEGLFALCKALVASRSQQSPCTFVSYFHAAEAANTAPCAALAAFYRSLTLENNRYNGRVLELDHRCIDAERSAIDTVTCIIEELESPAPWQTAIRYEAGNGGPARRFVLGLEQQHPEQQVAAELPLKHGGVYLITGGLGGLGYLFARHLAERYRARLVLSGRSAPNEESQRKLDRLRAFGADVMYVPSNVADADEARSLIETAKAQFGQLNGVLHSAGVNHDALLIRKERDSLRRVLAPKVQGTLHLDRLTAAEPLDLFVLFSSGAGSFGNVGQTDYAYANAFMDAFAEHRESRRGRRQRFGKTLSIAWPFWQDGGMQLPATDLQRTEQRTGMCALPTDIGLSYWETLLSSDMTHALALYGYPSTIAAYCSPPAELASQPPTNEAAIAPELLRTSTQQYLCELVERETKIPAARVDLNERFEAFGFDSVMIGRFNAALERDLGDLPKTLLYEHETVAELADYLCEAAPAALCRKLRTEVTTQSSARALPQEPATEAVAPVTLTHNEPIAIVGVHTYFPQAEDLHAFWEHLEAGDDLIQLVPPDRWNYAQFFDADPAQAERGKIYCKWGGFLDAFDRFDAGLFNISSAEADIIDPQERWFLQSAWAAVEDAGYTRERLKQLYPKGKSADVGVFVGVTTNSYHLLAPEAWQRGEMVTPSAMPWSIANRVSYHFDFQGPSLPVDTACSSSLVAVHLACESLRRRECQVALAGGVNLYLHPAKYQSFCQRRMLAVGSQCRSYGAGDDGFIPGEGVGTLVLKPLSLAERDRDHIYGVIRGSSFDHSGRSNGYATPNPNSQAQVISQALAQANVSARSISYIEGHGTGTQMGDSLELAAITQAFGQHTADKQFCALGSVKANIGHAESATSIAGIAKILLQFKHHQIAPSIHAEVANPDIDFARSPCILQTTLTPWPAPEQFPRRALINAFGAGGVNACAVLEEYVPTESGVRHETTGDFLFVLSAKNEPRLREYAARYLEFLERNPRGDIASLCYTVQVGREAMAERLALLVGSVAQLRASLQHWLEQHDPLVSTVHVWRGSVDQKRGSKQASREAREHMHKLCAAHDLTALAQLWVQGSDVDWQRLYGEQPHYKTALPSYPFARERHWISASRTTTHVAEPTSAPRLHPLISHNSSTLRQVSFDAALADDQYYAQDHKIQGQPVFPGAGFIEMACVAATIAGEQRVRQLRDIVWVQPLAFNRGSQHLQVCLSKVIGDSAEFGVVSFDDDQERVVHCEGRVVFEDGAVTKPAAAPALEEWQQRCREHRAATMYYQRFQRLGIDYGPAFQVVKEVLLGDGCALAKLQLAAEQAADFEQYILHPCLIDGALQSIAALLDTGNHAAGMHLPFAIDAIEILSTLTPSCHALIEQADDERSRGANILQFNIHILSESGEPLVRITNFCVRAWVPQEAAVHSHARITA
ncbi:SDR family NAD(P)-dependent oxidoreductase [Steroidobacter sp. S1-65]|uniref:SDR family NAD(P)-dependent oxidoreductase n=1 Tax=Steroidobacter gossypii TaxID=2805490 RepID=A0ABS1WUC8_9GAMM|nr:SDR family NAD(P)-dependent oxidoreductase [Steroidobacter gossypii]MBM0104580.1 SDR family NAD(P)-dependent oxidoreductase [Steroidobacter gossypii]